jgi:hypothetical protein
MRGVINITFMYLKPKVDMPIVLTLRLALISILHKRLSIDRLHSAKQISQVLPIEG